MATIDLGKIKLVWRGTYSGGTAYTVDDVVQHTDGGITSSFICTTNSTGNAPSTGGSVHGSWAYLAKGSGDATLTTQGDILYRDGSGNARLAKGTAGQALKMNSGATAPEWGTISTEKAIKQVVFSQTSTRFTSTSGSYVATPITMTITPTSASSKILIWCRMAHAVLSDVYPRYKWYRKIGSGSFSALNTEPTNSNGGASLGAYINMRHSPDTANKYEMQQVTDFFQDTTHNTTSAITYTLYGVCENGGEFFVNTTDHNEDGQQNDYNQVGTSNMMAWEMTV